MTSASNDASWSEANECTLLITTFSFVESGHIRNSSSTAQLNKLNKLLTTSICFPLPLKTKATAWIDTQWTNITATQLRTFTEGQPLNRILTIQRIVYTYYRILWSQFWHACNQSTLRQAASKAATLLNPCLAAREAHVVILSQLTWSGCFWVSASGKPFPGVCSTLDW